MKLIHATCLLVALLPLSSWAKLADRSRLVKHRQESGKVPHFQDNGRPIEGQAYRSSRGAHESAVFDRYQKSKETKKAVAPTKQSAPWKMPLETTPSGDAVLAGSPEDFERQLSSQLSGCCYTYQKYYAKDMCSLYGNDCSSGSTNSHDSGDQDCSQEGLSFIGISFSVNTASGNPYSYQLCDQFPMENIIDRNYEYVMSMDEDGWLVGGGYKQFDYSGKMPYVFYAVVLWFGSLL
jgi:hypothetical protein